MKMVIVAHKYHWGCIKTHHFYISNTQIFWEGGPTPLAPSALDLRCPFEMDWTPALAKILDPPLVHSN